MDTEPIEEFPDLTDHQRHVLGVVMSSRSRTEAAERLGVHRCTLYRWLKELELAEALEEAEHDAYQAASSKVVGSAEIAASVLVELAENPHTAQYVRAQSARTLLEFALKLKEMRDIEARILELEAQLR